MAAMRLHESRIRTILAAYLVGLSAKAVTTRAIVYDYVSENEAGVDPALANERNRVRTANRYLKRLRYGNHRPLLLNVNTPSFRDPHI